MKTREELLTRRKELYTHNKNRELLRAKKYREENRNKINEKRRKRYQENIEKERAYSLPRAKKWYKKNVDKKKHYDKLYGKKFNVVCRRLYSAMKNRILHQNGYENRVLDMDIETFLKISKNSTELRDIYEAWKKNGYDRNLSPTVDRIDNSKGYSVDNIQFIPMIENVNKYWKIDRFL